MSLLDLIEIFEMEQAIGLETGGDRQRFFEVEGLAGESYQQTVTRYYNELKGEER